MGVYIKGLSLPTDGLTEVTLFPDGRAEWSEWVLDPDGFDIEIQRRAIAVEVPTPHGRLIDAEADNGKE